MGRRDVRENEKNEKVRAIGNGPARFRSFRSPAEGHRVHARCEFVTQRVTNRRQ